MNDYHWMIHSGVTLNTVQNNANAAQATRWRRPHVETGAATGNRKDTDRGLHGPLWASRPEVTDRGSNHTAVHVSQVLGGHTREQGDMLWHTLPRNGRECRVRHGRLG